MVIHESDGLRIVFCRKSAADPNEKHTLFVEGPLVNKTQVYQVSDGDGADVLLMPVFVTTPYQMALAGTLLARHLPAIKKAVVEHDHPSQVTVPPALRATIQVATTKRAVGLVYLEYLERHPGQETNATLFAAFANRYLSAEIVVHRNEDTGDFPDRVECVTLRARKFVETFLERRPEVPSINPGNDSHRQAWKKGATGYRMTTLAADCLLREARRCEIMARQTTPAEAK